MTKHMKEVVIVGAACLIGAYAYWSPSGDKAMIAASTPQVVTGYGAGTLKKNSVACSSRSGIQTAKYGMNTDQLESLNCMIVGFDMPVRRIDPQDASVHVRVTVQFPKEVSQLWVSSGAVNP